MSEHAPTESQITPNFSEVANMGTIELMLGYNKCVNGRRVRVNKISIKPCFHDSMSAHKPKYLLP
jgi:hypothetical protein